MWKLVIVFKHYVISSKIIKKKCTTHKENDNFAFRLNLVLKIRSALKVGHSFIGRVIQTCHVFKKKRIAIFQISKIKRKRGGREYFRYSRPKVNKFLSYFPLFYKVLTPTSVISSNSDVLRITVYDECNIKWVYPHLKR